jgi:Mannosyl-glycoprotein endo-beta-N-acetylglucosaminidase
MALEDYIPSFFNANAPADSPVSYESLQARRKIAEALLGRKRSGFPKTIGEGLTYLGERIADQRALAALEESSRAYGTAAEDVLRDPQTPRPAATEPVQPPAQSYDTRAANSGVVIPEGTPPEEGGYNEQDAAAGTGLNAAAYDRMFQGTPLAGQSGRIAQAAAANNIPPSLVAAVMAHESGQGTSRMARQRNNPAGLMDPATRWMTGQTFPDIGTGIDAAGRTIAQNYRRGGGSIEGMARSYAPPRAPNDPGNLNQFWPSGVRKFQQQLGPQAALPDSDDPFAASAQAMPDVQDTPDMYSLAPLGAPQQFAQRQPAGIRTDIPPAPLPRVPGPMEPPMAEAPAPQIGGRYTPPTRVEPIAPTKREELTADEKHGYALQADPRFRGDPVVAARAAAFIKRGQDIRDAEYARNTEKYKLEYGAFERGRAADEAWLRENPKRIREAEEAESKAARDKREYERFGAAGPKPFITNIEKSSENAAELPNTMIALTNARNVLNGDSRMFTGSSAELELSAAKLKAAMGFPADPRATATEQFKAYVKNLYGPLRKGVAGAGAQSDKDLNALQEATAAKTTLERPTMLAVLDSIERLSRQAAIQHQKKLATFTGDDPNEQRIWYNSHGLDMSLFVPEGAKARLREYAGSPDARRQFDAAFHTPGLAAQILGE